MRLSYGVGILTLALSGCAQPALSAVQERDAWQYPAIPAYGKVRSYPNAAARPVPDRDYRVLFDITKAAGTPDKVNPGLDHVARLLNLFALSGVPAESLKIALVIHGPATPIVLADERYRKLHGSDNPNTELIGLLKRAGVTLYICGQALAEKGFDPAGVNPAITLALSALTVLPIYQLDGYALIPD
ncbi:DsrE family protein [Candidatus Methylobacter favarea]|nr:DsrE family protein [Candidatus Methylobacter favarea]